MYRSVHFHVCVCEGTDPEYLQEVVRIEEERDKRLFVADSFLLYETQCAKDDFEREKSLAETEFEVCELLALSHKATILYHCVLMYVVLFV